jgi:hypothetical protein
MSLQIARFTSRASPPEGPDTALISAAGVRPLECFRRMPKIAGYTLLSIMTVILFLPEWLYIGEYARRYLTKLSGIYGVNPR